MPSKRGRGRPRPSAPGGEDDLGVAVGAEAVAERLQLGAQLAEVVDLAVEDDARAPVGRRPSAARQPARSMIASRRWPRPTPAARSRGRCRPGRGARCASDIRRAAPGSTGLGSRVVEICPRSRTCQLLRGSAMIGAVGEAVDRAELRERSARATAARDTIGSTRSRRDHAPSPPAVGRRAGAPSSPSSLAA